MTTRKYKRSRAFRTIRLTKRGGGFFGPSKVGPAPDPINELDYYNNELIKYFKHQDGTTGDIEKVLKLLKEGADPDGAAALSKRPLLDKAISYGYTEIAKLLLEYDAYPNNRDFFGNTTIYTAIRGGRIDFVKMLLDKGTTDLDNINRVGQTPLAFAENRLRNEKSPPGDNADKIEIYTEIVNMLKQAHNNRGGKSKSKSKRRRTRRNIRNKKGSRIKIKKEV
jgi:ankyrin repeat protein